LTWWFYEIEPCICFGSCTLAYSCRRASKNLSENQSNFEIEPNVGGDDFRRRHNLVVSKILNRFDIEPTVMGGEPEKVCRRRVSFSSSEIHINHPAPLNVPWRVTRAYRAGTQRSHVQLLCNFLDDIDIAVSFAFPKKGGFILSSGAKKIMKKKVISTDKWNKLEILRCCSNARVAKAEPLIIIELTDKIMFDIRVIVYEVNIMASKSMPMKLGIDDYRWIPLPPLDLLKMIHDYDQVFFSFYYKGYRDISFLNVVTFSFYHWS